MSRLIDADKLKAHYAWWKGGSREMTMDEAKSDFDCIIDLQPTVEPIKNGYWIVDRKYGNDVMSGERMVLCSVCGKGTLDGKHNYCPNCGARMLVEVENE